MEQKHLINELADENESLKDAVAAGRLPEGERDEAANIIKQLREELRIARNEVKALKVSRDDYMRENGAMKRQLERQRGIIKKLEGGKK